MPCKFDEVAGFDLEDLRDGVERIWYFDDLQSFTPLRFMPPKLMGHQGRAVVVDPDVFAVGDVYDLFSRDMQGAGVMGRRRSGKKEKAWQIATSVMLLDCDKLRHWEPEQEFDELFQFQRDYKDWIVLRHESAENIGILEDESPHVGQNETAADAVEQGLPHGLIEKLQLATDRLRGQVQRLRGPGNAALAGDCPEVVEMTVVEVTHGRILAG